MIAEEFIKEKLKNDLTIQEQKSVSPIDWNSLINAIDAKALNDRNLGQLQALEKELFGEE